MNKTNYTQRIRNFTINFGPQHPVVHGALRLVLGIKKRFYNFFFKNKLFGLELIAFIQKATEPDNNCTSSSQLDMLVLLKKVKPEGFMSESDAGIDIISIQQHGYVCFKMPKQVGEIQSMLAERIASGQDQYDSMILNCQKYVNSTVGNLTELNNSISVIGFDPVASTHLSDSCKLLGFLSHQPTLAVVVLVSSTGVVSYLKDADVIKYSRQCLNDFLIESKSRVILSKSYLGLLRGAGAPNTSVLKDNVLFSCTERFKDIFLNIPTTFTGVNASTNPVEVSGSVEISAIKTEITGVAGGINGIKGPVTGVAKDFIPSTSNDVSNINSNNKYTVLGNGDVYVINQYVSPPSTAWDRRAQLGGAVIVGAAVLPFTNPAIREVTFNEGKRAGQKVLANLTKVLRFFKW